MHRLPRLAALLLLLALSAHTALAAARLAGAAANECDRLGQPARKQMGRLPIYAEGVELARMDARAARAACEAAMAEVPTEMRFVAYAGRAADKMGDGREAARLYRQAADGGNALAQANLGAMYERGESGGPRDPPEAARLYKLAAEQGMPKAQANLGSMYTAGRGGLPRDDAEAVRLFHDAAEQDDPGGQTNLGVMYAEGRGGLPRDTHEAARLWRLAAEQGSTEARNNLRRLGPGR